MANEKCEMMNGKSASLIQHKQKGEQALPIPLQLYPVARLYAGAGLPPVIGGRIGFSGLADGSLS